MFNLKFSDATLTIKGNMYELFQTTELLLSALRNELLEAGESEAVANAILDKIVKNAKKAKDFSNIRLEATSEEVDKEILLSSILKNAAMESNGEEMLLERDYEMLTDNTEVHNRYARLRTDVK